MGKLRMSWPNRITIARILLIVPFVIAMLHINDPGYKPWARYVALAIFIAMSLSDAMDSFLARQNNCITRLGTFLDPLADKCLVLGAFITFVFLSEQIQVWMVLCILGRDIIITSFRYLAIYQGEILRTSRLAKIKTAFQMFSIIVILMSLMALSVSEYDLINQQYHSALETGLSRWGIAGSNAQKFLHGRYDNFVFGLTTFLPYYLMMLTTIITLVSLFRYLFTNFKLLLGPIPVIRPRRK